MVLEITAPSRIPGTHNYDTYLDKRLVVVLRDGRKLFAILRTFDQFGNLLLQDAYERLYVELEYAEEYRGVYLVRGENVVLVGELDEDEWQTMNKRMSKFRRPMDQIIGRWQREQKSLHAERLAASPSKDLEMTETDAY